MASSALSTLATASISTVSVIRILVRCSILVSPEHSADFFGVPLTPETTIVGRLFGGRDLVLGALLWSARASAASAASASAASASAASASASTSIASKLFDVASKRDMTAELRRALFFSIATDLIDVCSCVVGDLDGGVSGRAMGFLGGGAVSLAAFAGLGLSSL
jgi:hypothetical protein